ncbi:MAG TPA: sucrase ferredoxin [Acidimicrobiales bacterium]|jgi:hypothetical protein|nr:sucrase ferredoxin [Acidimicrobiales bacterium]
MRCSVSVHNAGLDPIGTANQVLGWVVVEWPLPWPPKVEAVAELATVRDRAADLGYRLQLAHHLDARVAPHRVLVAHRDRGPFRAFDVQAWSLGDRGGLDSAERRDALAALTLDALTGAVPSDPSVDLPRLLVCSHGARDVCCGSFGTHLASDLAAARPGLEIWRTSHLGGHRFAPTALSLPDGNLWAHLDVETAAGVADRSLDPAVAATHYRGCSATRPEAQLAERAALMAEGWSVFDAERETGAEPDAEASDGTGRLAWCVVRRRDGTATRYEGRVSVNREIHLPPCGGIDATELRHDLRIDDARVTSVA